MNELMKQKYSVLLVMALAGVAVFASARVALAQGEGTATLEGVIFDSTSMSVLSGARIAVLGTSAAGDADESGRFHLGDVPAGTHWVSFFHPRLQELGVSVPSRQVAFGPGQTVRLALTIPSHGTLLLGSCLAEQPTPGYSVIAGRVRDPVTGLPVARAIVTAEPVSRGVGMPRQVEVSTDDAGYFRMCSLRPDVDLRVQAHLGRDSGRSVEMVLPPATAWVQDLVLVVSSEGTLTGFVRDFVTGAPIAGAAVSVVASSSSTTTDLTGRFILDDLPPGRHLIKTEHVAFESRTDPITVFSDETVDIEVRMATEALEVEGLVVVGRTRFAPVARGARRADFISREEIEVLLPEITATADLLRTMITMGISVRDQYTVDEITGITVPSVCIEVSRRSVDGEACRPVAVALNDVIVPFPDQVIRDLDPNMIDRIQILSPIDARFQFGAVAGNGAILIRTR